VGGPKDRFVKKLKSLPEKGNICLGEFVGVVPLRKLDARRNRCHRAACAEKKTHANARSAQDRAGVERLRTRRIRRQPRVDAGRAMGANAEVSPLAQLLKALSDEGIRYLIVGMSGAVLQGVPYTTLDTDIWIDLPERRYMSILNLCRGLGAEVAANTVVVLPDGLIVNFLYRVDGLRTFNIEFSRGVRLEWFGHTVSVLPVERILRSKQSVGRPKDLAHLPILRAYLRCRQRLDQRGPPLGQHAQDRRRR
jgi:hypothetical protein